MQQNKNYITQKATKVINKYQKQQKKFSIFDGCFVPGVVGFLIMGIIWIVFG